MKSFFIGIYKMFIEPLLGIWIILTAVFGIGCLIAVTWLWFFRWLGINI